MTYHASSLRPHTDNYNHIYSFSTAESGCYYDKLTGKGGCRGKRRSWGRGTEKEGNSTEESDVGQLKTPSEGLPYQCFLHRVSFFTQVIVHSPPCPLKSHILPCLAKEHFLSVWVLSLPSCFVQWAWWGISCHTRCVKPFLL